MKDLSTTWVKTGRQFEDFRRKKEQKQTSQPFKITTKETRPLNTTLYSDNYCAGHKIISVPPKRLLKTETFEKKAIFSVKKTN